MSVSLPPYFINNAYAYYLMQEVLASQAMIFWIMSFCADKRGTLYVLRVAAKYNICDVRKPNIKVAL
jgi:hypothetical protein